jgi:amino-acid N-acetyltransferase
MSVLGSSATKRDARSYLSRFTPSSEPLARKPVLPPKDNSQISYGNGVNLGGFYGTARAVAESPKFVQHPQGQTHSATGPQLHVALVKIRAPQTLNDDTLSGIGRTLSQLGRLGLTSVIVVDCKDRAQSYPDSNSRNLAIEQANRIATALDASGETRARLVDDAIGISEKAPGVEDGSAAYLRGRVHVTLRKLLITPLKRGIVPVIPSIGYTDSSQTSFPVQADEVVLALTRELAGFQPALLPDEDPDVMKERLQALRKEVSLDRLIILDPLGGIPSSDRPNGYHVFLNMEQEFESAKQDLVGANLLESDQSSQKDDRVSDLGASNPFSKFVETELTGPRKSERSPLMPGATSVLDTDNTQHLQNLQLVRSVLSVLPPSSSALLTTPDEAANSGRERNAPFQAPEVGTRRLRNPLIHNLLTDKPVFSSSLPVGRLGLPTHSMKNEPVSPTVYMTPTTFAKHGMSVSIFPDPKVTRWEPPTPGKPRLRLTDSQIDLPRLVHLIEDSFNRKLDVEDYLKRVNERIAGVIIAGEYEGGALLTWETPPGVLDDGTAESRARMVPYLDKFAVLKRSQGSSVADVVFRAMVRDCFPSGVCWRSRRNNPVNKWYFERSRGTWKLPGTNWAMFWTTPDLSMDQQTFRDYEGVCRGIVPSWADNKTILD